MEFIQLLSFSQIVKTGSFSRASRSVFRSQSAVSHQIKKLENELRVKLFERVGKKINKVTEEGKFLFDITEKFFNDLELLKITYGKMQSGIIGNLTIAASIPAIRYIFPKIIRKFAKQFPGINFKLITCSSITEIVSLLLHGDIDLGVGARLKQTLPQKIIFLLWKSFDPLLITPKNHPLSYKKNIKLVDIAGYPHILYNKEAPLRNNVDAAYARNKIDYKLIVEVDSAENLKSYVEMEIGVGILSSLSITPQDKKKYFIANLNRILGKVDLGIYYRKDKHISNAMEKLLDALFKTNVQPAKLQREIKHTAFRLC